MRANFLLTLLGLSLAVSTSLCGTASGATKDTINVATNPSFVPFESRDPKTGNMVGFDIDLMRAIARQAGLHYKFQVLDFNGIIPALLTGSVDMAITGMTITAKRAQKISFSKPYYDSGLRLLVKTANTDIQSLNDLAGKPVATEVATTSFNYLKKHAPKANIIAFPQSSQMYMALKSGNAKAVLFDVPSVQYYINKRGHDQVKMVGPLYAGQQYGIAFPKGSKLVGKVNKALAALKDSGKFSSLYQKWFGQKPPKDLMDKGT